MSTHKIYTVNQALNCGQLSRTVKNLLTDAHGFMVVILGDMAVFYSMGGKDREGYPVPRRQSSQTCFPLLLLVC